MSLYAGKQAHSKSLFKNNSITLVIKLWVWKVGVVEWFNSDKGLTTSLPINNK
jgi:hypothetical protein